MERDFAAEIVAARRGEARAVDSLFARNMAPLVAFIRARAGHAIAARESASDIAQSVFREVLMDADRIELRGEGAFRNWLFMQATRKVLDRAKFHGRDRRDVSREVAIHYLGQKMGEAYAARSSEPSRLVEVTPTKVISWDYARESNP